MASTTPKQIVALGTIILFIFSLYAVVQMSSLKIKVASDKTTFYVKEKAWIIAGEEYNALYDADKLKVNRSIVHAEYDLILNYTILTRTTSYKNGPKITDTYFFQGTSNQVELFPVSHTIQIQGAKGLTYQYQAKKLIGLKVTGNNATANRNMNLEWDPADITIAEGSTLTLEYTNLSEDVTYNIRMFDPIAPNLINIALKWKGNALYGIAGGLASSGLNGTNMTQWNGTSGFMTTQTRTTMDTSSRKDYFNSDYSRIKDIAVACDNNNVGTMDLYFLNSTSGEILNTTRLVAPNTLSATERCVVMNQVNSTIFHIFYDDAASDSQIYYRKYNGTGSASNVYATEAVQTLVYPTAALGTGSIRAMRGKINPVAPDEYLISGISNGGTDSIHIMIFNTTSRTQVWNWTSTGVYNFNNLGGYQSNAIGATYTGDGSEVIWMWTNTTTSTVAVRYWWNYWNRSNNYVGTDTAFDGGVGHIRHIEACTMETQPDEAFFIYATNDSDVYAGARNINGTWTTITGDTGVEYNAGYENIACLNNNPFGRVYGFFVDSNLLAVDYFYYNATTRTFHTGTDAATTALTTTSTTANIATDDIRVLRIIPTPVPAGGMIITSDITVDVWSGAYLEGSLVNTTKAKILCDNGGLYSSFTFFFQPTNYNPNASSTFRNNSVLNTSEVILNASVSDINGDTLNVMFYNNSNNLALCTNNSIDSGATATCKVTLGANAELKWYFNITDNAQFPNNGGSSVIKSGLYNVTYYVEAPPGDPPMQITKHNVTASDSPINKSKANWTSYYSGIGMKYNYTIYNSTRMDAVVYSLDTPLKGGTTIREISNYGRPEELNGTCTSNCPAFDATCLGGRGCYTFNSTAGMNITIPDSSRLKGMTEMSVFVWFITGNDLQSQAILNNDLYTAAADVANWQLQVRSTDKYRVMLCDGISRTLFDFGNVTKNQWTYFGFTYDGEKVKGYVDAVNLANASLFFEVLNDYNNPLIVGLTATGTNPFNGSIAYIEIYNHTLSNEQITENYIKGLNRTRDLMAPETQANEIFTGKLISTNGTDYVESKYTFQTTPYPLNLSFGPPGTSVFRVAGCGPDKENFSALPEGQNSTYGIDLVCNNGTYTGDLYVELSGDPSVEWTISAANDSLKWTELSTIPHMIYGDLTAGACTYIWYNFTCEYAYTNPSVYEIYTLE